MQNLVVGEISCSGAEDGMLQLMPETDFPPYRLAWDNGAEDTLRSRLGPGSYAYTIENSLGCVIMDSVKLTEPSPIEIRSLIFGPSCFGTRDGKIEFTVSGGSGPYEVFSEMGNSMIPPFGLDSLLGGEYLFTIFDRNGCMADTLIRLIDPIPLLLELGPDLELLLGEELSIDPQTNAPPDSHFEWWIGDEEQLVTPWPISALPLEAGTVTVRVTTEQGCRAEDELSFSIKKPVDYIGPNSFSPNGDGRNDMFTLYGRPESAIIKELRIFDRWGNLVFVETGMSLNDEAQGWDGNFMGRVLPAGTYVYSALIERIDSQIISVFGDVTIVR